MLVVVLLLVFLERDGSGGPGCCLQVGWGRLSIMVKAGIAPSPPPSYSLSPILLDVVRRRRRMLWPLDGGHGDGPDAVEDCR